MGKQGHGIGKGKPKMKDKGFGNSLIRQQQIGAKGLNGLNYYADAEKKKTLLSNLESDDLSEYVEGLELADKDVNVHRVRSDATAAFLVEGTLQPQTVQNMTVTNFNYEHLPVPRKPEWNRNMSAEEVDKNERDSFLDWRRNIATMEEANAGRMKTTPFEKNLEVWRQLWRVLEKSDFSLQIIDARNPLLYYTEDLMSYAGTLGSPMMLLVNKADFLTEFQRKTWARQFDAMGIQFAFYSAAAAQAAIDTDAKLGSKSDQMLDEDDRNALKKARDALVACNEEEVHLLADDIAENWNRKKVGAGATLSPVKKEEGSAKACMENAAVIRRRCRMLTRLELIMLLEEIPKRLHLEAQTRHNGRICIGMTGFPNVGKSSCINSILGVSKSTHGVTRVAVSSTPGKTKHFQTLIVNDQVMLCDCPGLVFPSFMRSTGEMLCAGILPINQMRDYIDPAGVITARVPMHLIEAAYGTQIHRDLDIKDNPNRPPTGSEMLCAYCQTKGYITSGTGRWDEFRAAKEIIRDFCDGLLLYVAPPAASLTPQYSVGHAGDVQTETFDIRRWLQDTENIMMRKERIADRISAQRLKELELQENQKDDATGPRSTTEVISESHDGTVMVFGDGSWSQNVPSVFIEASGNAENNQASIGGNDTIDKATGAKEAFVYDDESSEDEGSSAAPQLTPQGLIKREHKRQKSWGKKGRKLRNKDPYGEENGRITMGQGIGTTSRAKTGYRTTPLAANVSTGTKRETKREKFSNPNHS